MRSELEPISSEVEEMLLDGRIIHPLVTLPLVKENQENLEKPVDFPNTEDNKDIGSGFKDIENITIYKEETVMSAGLTLKVSKKELVRLYQAVGFSSSDGWNDSQLVSRTKNLTEEDLNKVVGDNKDLLDEVLSVIESKGEIVISNSVEQTDSNKVSAVSNNNGSVTEESAMTTTATVIPETTPKKRGRPKGIKNTTNGVVVSGDGNSEVVSSKPTKEKSNTKPKPGKDKFGCFNGSISARINGVMGSKSMTTAEIAEESKLPEARVIAHITFWTKKGSGPGPFLVESNRGWKLTK